MNKIKSNCMECKYGQVYNTIENWFRCACEDNPDRIEVVGENYNFIVRESKEDCNHFIPTVDIDNDNIETRYSLSIHHKCPHCGHEDIHYTEEVESEETVVCESCGKKYEISWSIF